MRNPKYTSSFALTLILVLTTAIGSLEATANGPACLDFVVDAIQPLSLASVADLDHLLADAPAQVRASYRELPRTANGSFRALFLEQMLAMDALAKRWEAMSSDEKKSHFIEVSEQCNSILRNIKLGKGLQNRFEPNVSIAKILEQRRHLISVGRKKAEVEAWLAQAYQGKIDFLETQDSYRQTAHFVLPYQETIVPGTQLDYLQDFASSVFVATDLIAPILSPFGGSAEFTVNLHLEAGISRLAKEKIEIYAKRHKRSLVITGPVFEDVLPEGDPVAPVLSESKQKKLEKQAAKRAEWERRRLGREQAVAAQVAEPSKPVAEPGPHSPFESAVGQARLPIPSEPGSLQSSLPGLYEFVTAAESRFYAEMLELMRPKEGRKMGDVYQGALEASNRFSGAIEQARRALPTSLVARKSFERVLEQLKTLQDAQRIAIRDLRSGQVSDSGRLADQARQERRLWSDFAGVVIGLGGEARAVTLLGNVTDTNVKVRSRVDLSTLGPHGGMDHSLLSALRTEIDVVRAGPDGRELWTEVKNYYRPLEYSADPSSPYQEIRGQLERQIRASKLADRPVQVELLMMNGYSPRALAELRNLYPDVRFILL